MNLKDLKEKGGFVSSKPVKKEVVWKHKVDGAEVDETFTIHVRPMSYGDIERIFIDPKDEDRSRTAALLSESVLLGDDAKERLTYTDAYQLAPSLAAALSKVVSEVNALKN